MPYCLGVGVRWGSVSEFWRLLGSVVCFIASSNQVKNVKWLECIHSLNYLLNFSYESGIVVGTGDMEVGEHSSYPSGAHRGGETRKQEIVARLVWSSMARLRSGHTSFMGFSVTWLGWSRRTRESNVPGCLWLARLAVWLEVNLALHCPTITWPTHPAVPFPQGSGIIVGTQQERTQRNRRARFILHAQWFFLPRGGDERSIGNPRQPSPSPVSHLIVLCVAWMLFCNIPAGEFMWTLSGMETSPFSRVAPNQFLLKPMF